MDPSNPFRDFPVIGNRSPEEAARILRDLGDEETAAALESAAGGPPGGPATYGGKGWWPFQDKPWQHTAHAFGHLPSAPPGDGMRPIRHAGNIEADPSLKNSRVKISLDCLRVAAYPGRGVHHVLFDFYAQNQVSGQNVEHLHFNATYRAREGERAAILGFPVFIGLNVGSEGVAFKCFTVNVKNEQDEALLGFLDSDVFKGGLKLIKTAQPAIAPLSGMAVGLTKSLASRHKNVPVQDFYMGLDFTNIPTRARLAEGAYIAVQIPEMMASIWDWADWVYHPGTGQIVKVDDKRTLIPYNYLVFSVSRYEG
jgi:hypothetical protein